MKTVILAGGFGTRMPEESRLNPKPMIEIGGQPLLWHIMKIYSFFGVNEFIICAGYMQHKIKEYFADFFKNGSDITYDHTHGDEVKIYKNTVEPWKVTIVDTGLSTMTGGRLLRVLPYLNDEPFFLTYGDGVANVDMRLLLQYHRKKKSLMTVTAVRAPQRYGVLHTNEEGWVTQFREKSELDSPLINGGFMVLEPGIFNYLKDDTAILEREPMELLAMNRMLAAYPHKGFWQCMDTSYERVMLEKLWESGNAPWKLW